MPSTQSPDLVFGEAAVRIGLIRKEQLDECWRIQTAMRELGVEESLQRILIKRGFLTRSDTSRVLESLGVETSPIPGLVLLDLLGEGGHGRVYRARQRYTGREVAVKILDPRYARDRELVRRFLREARAVAGFSHPNIVAVLDAGHSHGLYYLVLEYVPGHSLRDILDKSGRLSEPEAVRIALQVAEAIAYLNRRGCIHRDIKPDNILIRRDGAAKLCDFGLAKWLEADQGLTRSGCIVGTPLYLSPEQIRGDRPVDVRSDLYSLGVTFYVMICGRPPFEGGSAEETMWLHLHRRPRDPEGASAGIRRVLSRLLAKDPSARYATPEMLVADLRSCLAPRVTPLPIRRGRIRIPLRPARGLPRFLNRFTGWLKGRICRPRQRDAA